MSKVHWLLFLATSVIARGEICEQIDGDCPDDCIAAGFEGNINHSAKFWISPAPLFTVIESMAFNAEQYILD